MQRRRRVYFILMIFHFLAWTSCQKKHTPSFLIIAVEKLSSDLVTCNDETTNSNSGTSLLCKESIRFTHSYSTSTQSAGSIGSLLTGLYPIDHKLHRSFDRIDPKIKTIQQIAHENSYATSFFSGSPSILKKTGLSDYFDIFDDSVASSQTEYFRDLNFQINQFNQWKKQINGSAFFSIIFNTELNQIKNIETDQTQFEKWDEKLYSLFESLKKENQWDDTYIILIGLNGQNKFNRPETNNYTNLHSENINVTTLIKAPRKKGDEGIFWKNDTYINLADIGQTIYSYFSVNSEEKLNKSDFSQFPIYTLKSFIDIQNKQNTTPPFDRPLLIESPSVLSQYKTSGRYALISKNQIFIENNNNFLEVYNLINDKNEVQNLNLKNETSEDSEKTKIESYYAILRKNNNFSENKILLNEFESLAKNNADYWQSFDNQLVILAKSFQSNNPLILTAFSKANRLKLTITEKQNLNEIKTQLLNSPNNCFSILNLQKIEKDNLRKCTDEFFLQFITFKRAKDLQENLENNKLQYELQKMQYFNENQKLSLNLSYYNVWGLYNPNKQILHPLVLIDPNFFSLRNQ